MKKQINILLVLITGLALASCKKEMMNYEGEDGIYFSVRSGPVGTTPSGWAWRPYTNVDFIKMPSSVKEYVANIKVTITGRVTDYDRTFRIEVNPDSTTAQAGVHYLPLASTYTIPANTVDGYIPVTLKRTVDLQTAGKRLGLRLVSNENFVLPFPEWIALPGVGESNRGNDTAWNATMHNITMSDMMVQPAIWRGSVVAATNKETGSWGAYTRKKLELMCTLFNLSYEDFGSSETMTLVLSSLITNEMTRYLTDKFNAGTPIKEDDGRLMWVGSVPWTSIIGVPYP
jgi:hypothetical protein